MGANNKINPKSLPWFPFYTGAWLSSPDVLAMTMPERGVYITILAACWQYGSIPTDPWKLSKLLNMRYEVTTRWLHKWSKLVVCVEHLCSEHVVAVYQPCSSCVVPKLQEFSETLTKNAPPEKQSRREQSRERVEVDVEAEPTPATATTPSPSTLPSQGKTDTEPVPSPAKKNPAAAPVAAPADYSVEPRSFESNEARAAWFRGREEFIAAQRKAKEARPAAAPVPPAPTASVAAPELEDIREWNEDRFGVSGERLRRCIVYQLDFSKDEWYRKAGINLASMNREKFIAKLNGDTPIGWSPESHGKRTKPVAADHVETDDERETREYRERIARLKKEGIKP